MQILQNIAECVGCHACYNICPEHAIAMLPDSEGFLIPQIDEGHCIKCGLCRKVCPIGKNDSNKSIPSCVVAYNRDFQERMQSASGGIANLLAKEILRHNGVVFGAAFDEKGGVYHCAIERVEDLQKFRGTKYIQSSIGNCYSNAKEILQAGHRVLFSGTPCQIGGLKSYLGKDYDALLTVDLICHGVPSPMIWMQYLHEICPKSSLAHATFRDKANGIGKARMRLEFTDGHVVEEPYLKNWFVKGFLGNLYLRSSCYHCHFKGQNRQADITLGDAWGVEKFAPSFGDNYGVSLVLLNTCKGKGAFNAIQEQCIWQPCDYELAMVDNPSADCSSPYPAGREIFWQQYQSLGVRRTVAKVLRKPVKKQVAEWMATLHYGTKYAVYCLLKNLQRVCIRAKR